ncbi:MAG: DUF2868 domain-containing protein [Planctomycetota bacterium]|nr:DUF2868 domain-containing protein [Planctomycetota bacterium]
MAAKHHKRRRLEVADLIDLELQLRQDQTTDIEQLRKRDGEIGTQIGADQLQGTSLLAAWLDQLRRREHASVETTGQKAERYLELIGLLLGMLGLLFGIVAVVPWLAYDTQRPVNVIFFWSSLVGFQVVLLLLWLVAVMPAAWLAVLPGGPAVQTLLRAIGRIPPAMLSWLANRVSSDYRKVIDVVRGEARRLDWLYGQLRLWLLVRLTQIFAVTFNVGAIVAFVAISYGNDPTFGWRSTMLEPSALHHVTRIIGAPWSGWEPGIPSSHQIEETRYSKLEDQAFHRDQMSVWAAWWPFLLASLLGYGLLPRLLTWLIAHWKVRHALRCARLEHHDVQKLIERLRRPLVETQALTAEEEAEAAASGPGLKQGAIDLGSGPLTVLQWAGVSLERPQVEQILHDRWGAGAGQLYQVGGLDEGCDRQALDALHGGANVGQVLLLVEAWEPPVAEYLDFITQMRERLGEGVLIVVLLFHRDQQGTPVCPTAEDREIWQRCLAAAGDPWLAVRPLIEEAAQEQAPLATEGDG